MGSDTFGITISFRYDSFVTEDYSGLSISRFSVVSGKKRGSQGIVTSMVLKNICLSKELSFPNCFHGSLWFWSGDSFVTEDNSDLPICFSNWFQNLK